MTDKIKDGAAYAAAVRIKRQCFSNAATMFLAGSFVRDENTETSDLDLVVIFNALPAAYRQSFHFERFPVEAFVHDPQTLRYFFHNIDGPMAIPSLATMISEGVEIPGCTETGSKIKSLADQVLAQGPPPWNRQDIDKSRYAITDRIDDLRAPRSTAEMTGTVASLYSLLANHYFRSRGLWAAQYKNVDRYLREHDTDFADRFHQAFSQSLRESDGELIIRLAEQILTKDGGWLFDGYSQVAPEHWRQSEDPA